MAEQEYEFVRGTPEQVEVFMDLQRLIVRLYNEWPGDTAFAIFASAIGCSTALIETQYKMHLDECKTCQRELPAELDLVSIVRDNFEHYYNTQKRQAAEDVVEAKKMVESFFCKGK